MKELHIYSSNKSTLYTKGTIEKLKEIGDKMFTEKLINAYIIVEYIDTKRFIYHIKGAHSHKWEFKSSKWLKSNQPIDTIVDTNNKSVSINVFDMHSLFHIITYSSHWDDYIQHINTTYNKMIHSAFNGVLDMQFETSSKNFINFDSTTMALKKIAKKSIKYLNELNKITGE